MGLRADNLKATLWWRPATGPYLGGGRRERAIRIHTSRHHANTVCKAKANYNYMNMLALQEACPELWRPHEHPIG
jgi:hypothetical protein